MRRIIQIALALSALLCAFAAISCGGGGGTPGDSRTETGSLSSSLPSYTDGNGAIHYVRAYTFTANQDGNASIIASSTDFVPLPAVLEGTPDNASGAPPNLQLSVDSSAADGTTIVTETFDVTNGSDYIVGVTGAGDGDTGNFQLTFSPELSNVRSASLNRSEQSTLLKIKAASPGLRH
ncbi:MAG TPA: hypothetical protein VFJ58_15450 [Armatimonadota bacterium]|nr:hypothetical protein [Armatimonadota bacterium]